MTKQEWAEYWKNHPFQVVAAMLTFGMTASVSLVAILGVLCRVFVWAIGV